MGGQRLNLIVIGKGACEGGTKLQYRVSFSLFFLFSVFVSLCIQLFMWMSILGYIHTYSYTMGCKYIQKPEVLVLYISHIFQAGSFTWMWNSSMSQEVSQIGRDPASVIPVLDLQEYFTAPSLIMWIPGNRMKSSCLHYKYFTNYFSVPSLGSQTGTRDNPVLIVSEWVN